MGNKAIRSCAAAVVGVAGLAAPVLAQNDRILDTPASGWSYLYSATGPDIAAQASNGFRPFGIERVGTGQYDTVFIGNSGVYAVSGSTVVYGLTATNLQNTLTSGGYRILDLEAYDNGSGGTLFTAVLVPNSGGTGTPNWGWLYNTTFASIQSWMLANPTLRLIDLDVYEINGVRQYSAVAVHNSGSNFQSASWYMNNATATEISDALSANGARLTQIEIVSPATLQNPTTFAAVMVSCNQGGGWWYPSLTSQQVADLHNQNGARLTALKRYQVLGQTRWAVAMVDNANPQTRRMRQYMDDALDNGTYGFMLRQVGGPVLANLNSGFIYEPASVIKIVHAAYAVRRCSLGLDDLENMVYVQNRCTTQDAANQCPDPYYYCNQGEEELQETIRWMMQISHNGRTRNIEERYGRSTINSFLDNNGLGDIQINHVIGCLCGNTHNQMSADHLTLLYEKINDGTFFSGAWRDTLADLMINLQDRGYDLYPTLGNLINQEAASTDLTATEIANFRAAMQVASKGGRYGCGTTRWKTDGGWAEIPFKVNIGGGYATLPRRYAFATFVHGSTDDAGAGIAYSAKEEILREQVREALESWDTACVAAGFFSQPSSQTAPPGGSVTFSSSIVGTAGAYSYQWQHQSSIGGSWSNVTNLLGRFSGATTTSLTISNIVSNDAGGYRLRVSADCGTSWSNAATLTVGSPPTCYANCDNSTSSPVLNVADFTCFLQRFAAGQSYANCDNSTAQPVLNVADFTCFLQRFAAGCP
jgi:hypothetical protein